MFHIRNKQFYIQLGTLITKKKKMDEIEKLRATKIVPVVAIDDSANADNLAQALVAGGLPCAEITFRTEAALESIRVMAKRGDMQVGAGTVLKTSQVDSAIDAGATFIVAPGFNPKVVEYCVSRNIPIVPGVSTPTEIEMALEFDLNILKFFPAEASGGLPFLKAISAPYNQVEFMPTGGIGPKNVSSYLEFSKIVACGGSWMVKSDMIQNQQFEKITEITTEAVKLAIPFR